MSYKNDKIKKIDARKFHELFQRKKVLSEGTDGQVSRFEHRHNGSFVAVKESKPGRSHELENEIKAFSKVPNHGNIVQLAGYSLNWMPIAPALVMEHADFGDVWHYNILLRQQRGDVPEMTLWKFLEDMSRGLDFLHNNLEEPFVHGDLKPGNILVFAPPKWNGQKIPVLPTFKICDISRMQPAVKGDTDPALKDEPFYGTPEYGPPHAERKGPGLLARPVDIWAIGGSLQYLALDTDPIMTRRQFVQHLQDLYEEAEDLPTEAQLVGNHQWRAEIPVVVRPLNASEFDQKTFWNIERPKPPYSDVFNEWYKATMVTEPEARISARNLVEWYVPVAGTQIDLMQAKERREEARKKLEELKGEYEEVRNRRLGEGDYVTF